MGETDELGDRVFQQIVEILDNGLGFGLAGSVEPFEQLASFLASRLPGFGVGEEAVMRLHFFGLRSDGHRIKDDHFALLGRKLAEHFRLEPTNHAPETNRESE